MDKQQASDQPNRLEPTEAPNSSPTDSGRSPFYYGIISLLVIVGLVFFFVWVNKPLEQLWDWAKALLGLTFIVFVHELGHFAVAKWCDVHVQTFSIGFGPAIPGCRFRKGETTYMLAMFPLGGYVKMVGEGTEEEDDEDDPRSFKNKSVGQRMAIISAGVIMNLIFGSLFFVLAFERGVDARAAVVGAVEVNSPAWKKGVRSGDVPELIGKSKSPTFEDLTYEVMLSTKGEQLPLVVSQPGEAPREIKITPRRISTDSKPVIGIVPATQLKLIPNSPRFRPLPVRLGSAAALARELDLKPGDRVLATTNPADPKDMLELSVSQPGRTLEWETLCKRFRQLADQPIRVRIQRSLGKIEEETLDKEPFHFDDEFIATTDVEQDISTYDPFIIKELPVDRRDVSGKNLDILEFSHRLKRLAGKPMVVCVRRVGPGRENQEIKILVPPEYHYTIPGMIMEMGPITGIRENSPAAKAFKALFQQTDAFEFSDDFDKNLEASTPFIRQVEMEGFLGDVRQIKVFSTSSLRDAKGIDGKPAMEVLDPLRLPYELRRWADAHTKVTATLTVSLLNHKSHEQEIRKLPPMEWEFRWRDDEELMGMTSPLPIPELGLAYQVKTTVARVDADSEAYKAGLRKDDTIWEVTFKKLGKEDRNSDWERSSTPLWSENKQAQKDEEKEKADPYWPTVFSAMQTDDLKVIRFLVKRPGEKDKSPVEVDLRPDESWPIDDRGFMLIMPQTRLQKASDFWNACVMGLRYTSQIIHSTYLGLRSMVTGRIAIEKGVSGPISILAFAKSIAGKDFAEFLRFLGLISISLAVFNFLPIPLLDGGHMVFLIYEKLRGKPASERVREIFAYVGLAFIVSLVLVVTFFDVKRLWQAW